MCLVGYWPGGGNLGIGVGVAMGGGVADGGTLGIGVGVAIGGNVCQSDAPVLPPIGWACSFFPNAVAVKSNNNMTFFIYIVFYLFIESGYPIDNIALGLSAEKRVKFVTPAPIDNGLFTKGRQPSEKPRFIPLHSALRLTCCNISYEILPKTAVPYLPWPASISLGLLYKKRPVPIPML